MISILKSPTNAGVGPGRVGAVRAAPVDAHRPPPAQLDEVPGTVAVEVAGEEGELPQAEVVQVDPEGAGEVEARDRPEGAVP